MVPGYLQHKELLLRWARESLIYGVRHGHAPHTDVSKFPTSLCAPGAVFITLEKHGQLRGCIGHLEATQALVKDIAENAFAAAIEDPRFPAVVMDEVDDITISISILTPPEPMTITSEDDLLKQLRPGIDGLILSEGRRKATFLPAVWEELPNPRDFVTHLKHKAGWAANYWSDKIKAQRYESIYLSENP